MSAKAPKENPTDALHGVDIGKILSSAGPTVQCVLLKHMSPTGRDTKPHAAVKDSDEAAKDGHPHSRPVLTELITEVLVDTTPSQNKVQAILGGPFTFLGQYPDEEIVLMARRELPDDVEELSIHKIRELCKEYDVDTSQMLEKQELVSALLNAQLPVNPHQLQPPLDGIVVRGDILLMKVAETDEVLDKEDEDGETAGGADAATEPKVVPPSNDEFFLNYSKKEWVAFASRTDVVAPEIPEADEAEAHDGEEDEEDDEYDVAHEGEDDDEDDEDDRKAMLNLIMGEVLKRFREENGRGPDTRELLKLRSQVAEQLGVEVAVFEEDAEEEDDAKRAADEPADGEGSPKKVKFTQETKEGDDKDNKDDEAAGEKKTEEES